MRLTPKAGPERCPFCHDALGTLAQTACKSCGAVYHQECTTSCANLGCRGPLSRARPPFAVSWLELAVGYLALLCGLARLHPVALALGLVVPAPAYLAYVILASAAGAPGPPPPAPRPRLPTSPNDVAPAPSLADLARGEDVRTGAGALPLSTDAIEAAERQREALHARIRAPGLGRTIG